MTVVVADDDSVYLDTVATYVAQIGMNVIRANSGNEAFQIIQNQCVDGVITDLRMGNGTGIELLRKIRNNKTTLPRVPKIIVNTGLFDANTGLDYLKALGASQVYLKPISLEILVGNLIGLIK